MADDVLARHDSRRSLTGWVTSVTFVAALSLWALVSGHWSAWQASRVEVNQDAEMKARSEQTSQARWCSR